METLIYATGAVTLAPMLLSFAINFGTAFGAAFGRTFGGALGSVFGSTAGAMVVYPANLIRRRSATPLIACDGEWVIV